MSQRLSADRGGPSLLGDPGTSRDDERHENGRDNADQEPPALAVEGRLEAVRGRRRRGSGGRRRELHGRARLGRRPPRPERGGKTTLIKSILGTVLPDSGTVRLFGTDAASGRRAAYADIDAMLEGARNDYWRLTVRENLRYFATISGVDPDSVTARHDRLLDRLGLAGKADTPVRELSRGMKQKVSLASVLAGGAELVFLDEPTLGLDVGSSRTLREELRRLADEEDLTIVLSSHDMDVIEAVCDRVIVMAGGRIVADDTVSALVSSEPTTASK